MIHPTFAAFELIVYALLIACTVHAARRGPAYVAELYGALLFGLLLEYVNVTFLPGYVYGRFLVMLGPIPLAIGAGWATIIYTAMALTDRLGLSMWTHAPADGLLALNIDLSMDAVAIRLGDGMWVWSWPAGMRWTAEWFGVPFGNFYGWFWVVTLYSLWVRVFRRAGDRRGWGLAWSLAYPILAVALSEAILYGLLSLFRRLWLAGAPSALIFVAVLVPAQVWFSDAAGCATAASRAAGLSRPCRSRSTSTSSPCSS